MSELLFQTDPQAMNAGQFPDLAPEMPPLIEDAQNISFEAGAARPTPSQVLMLSRVRQEPIAGMNSQLVEDRETLIFGNQKNLYGWDEINGVHNLTGGTYSLKLVAVEPLRCDRWSIVSWGEWTLAARGAGNLQLRKPVDPFYDTLFEPLVTGSPPTNVKLLVRRSPFMLAVNSSKGPSNYAWCDADDLEDWVPSPTNLAGSNTLRDTDSDIVAAIPFRGEVMLFCENSMHQVFFSGAPLVFGDRKLMTGIGAVGQDSIAATGDRIFGVGKRGIWMTDGSSYDYIDTPAVRHYFLNSLNAKQASQIVAWHDQDNERVVFYYPNHVYSQLGHNRNDFGLIYSYRYKNWNVTTIGRTSADKANVFGLALTGDVYGDIFGQSLKVLPPGQLIDPRIPVHESWSMTSGYGECGYGLLGYGGEAGEDAKPAGFPPSGSVVLKHTDFNTKQVVWYPAIVPNQSAAAWFITKDLNLGSPKDKYIDGIVIKLDPGQNLQGMVVQWACKDRLSDPDVWNDEVITGLGDIVLRPRITCRYIKIRLEDSFILERWQIPSIQFWGQFMEGRVDFDA